MPGLPTAPLPAAGMTPESMIQQEYERGKRQIEQRFQFGFDEIKRRSSMLGPQKSQALLTDLETKARQEAMEYVQSMQSRVAELKQIDNMNRRGLVTNANEAKWRLVLGPEAEASMFPRETAPKSLESQMASLEAQENRLRSDASEFIVGSAGRVPHWYNFALFPRHEEQQPEKTYIRTYDPTAEGIVQFDDKDYVPATPEEIRYSSQLKQELRNIRRRKQELLNQPDVANRLKRIAFTSKDMMGGTLAQDMRATIEKRTPKVFAPPKPVRFTSPDGSKTYTVPGERVAEFTRQFPNYKRVK